MVAGGTGAAALLTACNGGADAPATGDPAAEPSVLANIADIPVGGAITASSESAGDVLLTQPVEGEVHAFSMVCTHGGCAVAPGEGDLACPCHGSHFDLVTGEPTKGPARDPLPEIAIEIGDDGAVLG